MTRLPSCILVRQGAGDTSVRSTSFTRIFCSSFSVSLPAAPLDSNCSTDDADGMTGPMPGKVSM